MSKNMSDEAKAAKAAYMREYRKKHRDSINAYYQKWKSKNKDRVSQYNAAYWEKKAAVKDTKL